MQVLRCDGYMCDMWTVLADPLLVFIFWGRPGPSYTTARRLLDTFTT